MEENWSLPRKQLLTAMLKAYFFCIINYLVGVSPDNHIKPIYQLFTAFSMSQCILRNISQNTVCQFYSHSIEFAKIQFVSFTHIQQNNRFHPHLALSLHIKQILFTCDRNYLKSMSERNTQHKHFNKPLFYKLLLFWTISKLQNYF